MTPVRTAAYAMLSAIFVKSGADAVMSPERLAPRAKGMTDKVAPTLTRVHEKAPTDAKTLVQINGAVQAIGGALLVTRLRRPAAVALAATLVPTTVAGHAFWDQDASTDRSQQLTHFLKNVGLFGGLMLAALDTGGKPGLRWRAAHVAHDAGRRAQYANKSARRAARHQRDSVIRAARQQRDSVVRAARHQRDKVDIAVKAAAAGRKVG